MTELLYMHGFDIEACEAKVLSFSLIENGRTDIILDQTCFYARGGGQDWDRGVISGPKAVSSVEEVHLDEEGQVHHIGRLASGSFSEADGVMCVVDHERRSVNTRLHSAAHVIDMAVDSLGLDWIATKGQHYPHLSAVEYSGTWNPEKAEELRTELEALTDAFIKKGSSNIIRFMFVEEMKTICRHVPDNIPKNKPGRVVLYGDNFGIPCGGTHVRDIRQVGEINIPKIKEKKGAIRVSYTVEGIGSATQD